MCEEILTAIPESHELSPGNAPDIWLMPVDMRGRFVIEANVGCDRELNDSDYQGQLKEFDEIIAYARELAYQEMTGTGGAK